MLRDRTDHPRRKICLSAVRVQQHALGQLDCHGIHRRIAPIEILRNRHRWIEHNGKAAIPHARLAFPACKGNLAPRPIHTHMIDGKGFSDLLRMRKKRTQPLLRHARHDIVNVLCRHAAKAVAHTAAHAKDTRTCAAYALDKNGFRHPLTPRKRKSITQRDALISIGGPTWT